MNDEEIKEAHLQEATIIKDEVVKETSAESDFDSEWWAKPANDVNEICKPYDKK